MKSMKKGKRVPKFKSEDEEARFWEKESPLDYPSDVKRVKDPFQFSVEFLEKAAKRHREKKRSLTLRMEYSLILLAKIIAKKRGDYYQALLRNWIRSGIMKELTDHPEMKQAIRKENLHFLHG
jgi:predicted DNA binding CopG/RHH family protein